MIIDEKLAHLVIKPRQKDSHKGSYGNVLLIGGIYPYGGAIIMAAMATVNSGAGLVTVATDRDNISPLHSQIPEAMGFDIDDIDFLKTAIKRATVILIGPGLGENSRAQKTFNCVLETISSEQILIIDGSALNLLAQKDQVVWLTNQLVLTPHQKEWERLSGIAISDQTIQNNKKILRRFPKGTVLVAKSSATKVYQGEAIGDFHVGGPYQATGGMGDTLCGLIAGFTAQFRDDLFNSVAVATFLHSFIAENLSHQAYVVLPTRISQELPSVMKAISKAIL